VKSIIRETLGILTGKNFLMNFVATLGQRLLEVQGCKPQPSDPQPNMSWQYATATPIMFKSFPFDAEI